MRFREKDHDSILSELKPHKRKTKKKKKKRKKLKLAEAGKNPPLK